MKFCVQIAPVGRRCAVVLGVLATSAWAWANPLDWFGATFAGYTAGQPLSAQGASGGAWQSFDGSVATNVFDGVRNGISIKTEGDREVSFVPVVPAGRDIERIDFSLYPGALGGQAVEDFDGAAGLSPAILKDGTPGYFGFTADGWIPLTGEGVSPEEGRWMDGRIELRTVEGLRLVSYLVKNGDNWVRLANAAGTTWFRTSPPRVQGGVASVSFTGEGRFSDFTGKEDDGDPLNVFHWIGGAQGDWNSPDNWSLNGTASTVVPSADNDLAMVPGSVEISHGSEQGKVTDLLVGFSSGSPQVLGGSVKTDVKLDVSRPRVGKALKAEFGTLFGMAPTYTFAWQLGTMSSSSGGHTWGGTVSTDKSYTPKAADLEHWIRFTAKDGGTTVLQKDFLMSKLPVVYMTTEGGQTPSQNKETHNGTLYAQGNDEWKMQYDGDMTIKVRGNSTKTYAKKPYKIKLDSKTKMFGLGQKKNKHWVLLANYNDMCQFRNKLAYDFANDIGGTLGMESTWVECVLNGDYLGTYLFCEHIRPAEDRCPVYDWEGAAGDLAEAFASANHLTSDQEDELATQLEQNLAWVTSDNFSYYDRTNNVTLTGVPSQVWPDFSNDITGGYVFEFSQENDEVTKFRTYSGRLQLYSMLNSPAYLKTNSQMLQYCQNFLQNYFDACTSMNGYSKENKHWSEYCDVDSMVGFWLVNELYANNDSCKKSRYAYKEQGEKLVWGPVWDFDWGMASVVVGNNPNNWATITSSSSGGEIDLYSVCKEWAADPWFCTKLYERYWEIRDIYAHAAETGGLMESYGEYLKETWAADDKRWASASTRKNRTGEGDAAILKTFLSTRLTWLDRQFASVSTLLASCHSSVQSSPYTADSSVLPMAFDNLTSTDAVYDNVPLKLSMAVSSSTATTVDVFVNGLRVGTVPVVNRRIAFDIPAKAFTAPKGRLNCVSLVAYKSSGEVRARNFTLVTQIPAGSILLIR